MSIAVRFLGELTKRLVVRGGSEEMLHALTSRAGEKGLDQLADLIVSLKWREPVALSRIKDMSHRNALEEHGSDPGDAAIVESDGLFLWEVALRDLGIPILCFGEDADSSVEWPLPADIESQLAMKEIRPGMPISYRGHAYIVTGVGYNNGYAKQGDRFDPNNLYFLHLSLAHHFDLNK